LPSTEVDPTESGLPPDVSSTVVTVGTFDGVHLGHQMVLSRLAARAAERNTRSVLVTFEPHPLEIVNPSVAPHLLTVGDEKLEVLAESGIDYLAVVPFTRHLASWEADRFVDEVLVSRFRVAHLLMGHDHAFGRNRSGNVEVLQRLGESRGFTVEVIEPVSAGSAGPPISSTFLRRAVAGGDLSHAREGLGRPYALGGRVVHGAKRGRLLGFPTINVPLPSPRKLLPPQGVYAARVQTPRGAFGGMLNLGARPTFDDDSITIEVHLFDVTDDFYGMRVRIDFLTRIRDTVRFDGIEALVAQLRRDETDARKVLALEP
jgi:riboflavin kinase/FMN adenylyltransferase